MYPSSTGPHLPSTGPRRLAPPAARELVPDAAPRLDPPAGRMEGLRVRLSDPGAGIVDVHVAERRGVLEVSVRSGDAPLAAELRRGLPPLLEKLDRSGIEVQSATLGRDPLDPEAFRQGTEQPPPGNNQAAAERDPQTGDREDPRSRRPPRRFWPPRHRTGTGELFSLATEPNLQEVTL